MIQNGIKGDAFSYRNDITELNSRVLNLAVDINTNYDRFRNRSTKSLDKLSELAAFHFAETNGLTLKINTGDWQQLCHQDYPSVVKHSDGRFLLLIRASNIGVLLFDNSTRKTSILSTENFFKIWSGYALTFHNKSKA